MAATSDVVILYEDPIWKGEYSKKTDEIVDRGDLMAYYSSTHTIDCFDLEADDDKFIGVSCDKSAAADTYKILVLYKGIVNIKVATAAYEVGAAMRYSSGNAETAYVLKAASSGAKGFMWMLEYSASGTGPFKCAFDVFLVGTGTGSGAGLFEGFAG